MNTSIARVDFGDKIYVYLKSGGIGVYFEEIDEDISLSGIISYKS